MGDPADRYTFKENLSVGVRGSNWNASIWRKKRSGLMARFGPKTVWGPEQFEPRPIFSVDAERTRLVESHLGGHWAIGAVIMLPGRRILGATGPDICAAFGGMVDPDTMPLSPWVRENVVPYVDLPLYNSCDELLEAFWALWMTWRDRVKVVTDLGLQVESTLFAAAQALDLDAREFLGPYPAHEVATILDAAGIDPDIDRMEFADQGIDFKKHNPVDDAILSGYCWYRAREMLYVRQHFQSPWQRVRGRLHRPKRSR
jgi:hypothetical protein